MFMKFKLPDTLTRSSHSLARFLREKGARACFPVFFIAVTVLFSCSESEEESHELDNWEERNWEYFTDVYTTADNEGEENGWKIIRNWSYEEDAATDTDDYIVVEVLEEGTGSGSPMYTDTVYVHYYGRLIPSDSYPDGYNFDGSYSGDFNRETALPSKFAVSALIDGFTTALLNMCIGDYWRVYVPWNLGYGTSTSGTIPGYSVLIFDIYLEAYYRVDEVVPLWKAKRSDLFDWEELR